MFEDKIKARLNALLEQGKDVLHSRRSPRQGVSGSAYVDETIFFHWKAGSFSFLQTVFGEDSTHLRLFSKNCINARYPDAVQGQGILEAANDDIEGGFLSKLESLVAADVFSDFLEMAEHLMEKGYKDPAASLLGAVLEDGLRRIAFNNGVKVKETENISSLNKRLADAEIFNRVTQKQIEFWNSVRDYADHGKFDKYDVDKVREMLRGVRGFLAEHL